MEAEICQKFQEHRSVGYSKWLKLVDCVSGIMLNVLLVLFANYCICNVLTSHLSPYIYISFENVCFFTIFSLRMERKCKPIVSKTSLCTNSRSLLFLPGYAYFDVAILYYFIIRYRFAGVVYVGLKCRICFSSVVLLMIISFWTLLSSY